MPLKGKLNQFGTFQPKDVELLGRVFDATSAPDETWEQRDERAVRILSLFSNGCRDEEELCRLVRPPD